MSEYQLKIANNNNSITIDNVKKIVPNFINKELFVLHYKNLQLYLRLGLNSKEVHRVLKLEQSKHLKPYIKFNTQKRLEAKKNGDKNGKHSTN